MTSIDGLINVVDYFTNTTYTYDKAGRLTQIANSAYNYITYATFEETHDYTYDKGNRVTSYSNDFGGVDADYSYDVTDQLTGADYATQTDEAYTYDSNGNRVGSGVEIGAHNRLVSDGTYRYEYDGEGNRTRRYVDDDQSGTFNAGDSDVTEYVWDYRNRLVTVASYDEHEGDLLQQVDYSYDAGNQLVKRTVDPDGDTGSGAIEQTIYVHDQGQVALQFDKTGSGSVAAGDLSHRYLWSPGVVDQLLTDEHVNDLFDAEENETLWALTDRLGSVTDMVDSNATLRLHRVFDSFGNIVEETHYDEIGVEVTPEYDGYLDVAFAYTGRLLDKATGLQNNLNRWYDASVGRWMSEDPIGFNAGDANLYRYVGNGPVNGTDPSGLDPWNAMPGTPHPFVPEDPVVEVPMMPRLPCLAQGLIVGIATGSPIGGALQCITCEMDLTWPVDPLQPWEYEPEPVPRPKPKPKPRWPYGDPTPRPVDPGNGYEPPTYNPYDPDPYPQLWPAN